MSKKTNQTFLNKKWVEDQIVRYVVSGYPVIYFNTFEDLKVLNILKNAGKEIGVDGIFTFDEYKGLRCWYEKEKETFEKEIRFGDRKTLEETAEFILGLGKKEAFIVFRDAHLIFDAGSEKAKYNLQIFKNMLQENAGRPISFHLISQRINIPIEFARDVITIDVPFPSREEIQEVFENTIKPYGYPVKDNLRNKFVEAMTGLGEEEIKNLINYCFQEDDNTIDEKDLPAVKYYKQQMIRKTNVLELIAEGEEFKLENIGGLEPLKRWLGKKKKIYDNMEKARHYKIDTFKGMLIAGMPGCGKSMTAKAASSLFEVPLLRLDMGMILGRYVGDSEQNIRQAIKLAESIAPCVLWIDELEKAFRGAGGESSGGGSETMTRVFGTILTWMQEKTKPVFVIAVANNIDGIPPEFSRKGRFDELFFVDFPTPDERKCILKIHIEMRFGDVKDTDKMLQNLNFDEIVKKMKNFSGAEIEAVLQEILEDKLVNMLSDGTSMNIETKDFLDKLTNFTTLYKTNKDKMDKMRKRQEVLGFKKAN